MSDPFCVQRFLDAAVAGLDHIGGHGADEGVERLGLDRIDHAVADFSWIQAVGGEAFA